MLFRNILFYRNFSFADYNWAADHAYPFAIPLTAELLHNKAPLFEALYGSKYNFCFVLSRELINASHEKAALQSFAQELTALLFLPQYIRFKGNHLILMEADGKKDASLHAFKKELAGELFKQGITKCIVTPYNEPAGKEDLKDEESPIDTSLNDYLESNGNKPSFDSLVKNLIAPPALSKIWIVKTERQENLHSKIQSLHQFEKQLLDNYPSLAGFAAAYYDKEETISELTRENENLNLKLKNHVQYLKLLKENAMWYVHEHARLTQEVQLLQQQSSSGPGQHTHEHSKLTAEIRKLQQASSFADNSPLLTEIEALKSNRNTIIEWYNNEYEVLPIWYKRFGHIIKVITGKRTFKSLYKKNNSTEK